MAISLSEAQAAMNVAYERVVRHGRDFLSAKNQERLAIDHHMWLTDRLKYAERHADDMAVKRLLCSLHDQDATVRRREEEKLQKKEFFGRSLIVYQSARRVYELAGGREPERPYQQF